MSDGLDWTGLATELLACAEFVNLDAKQKALFVPPGHFYSPIVDVEQVRQQYGVVQPNIMPAGIKVDDAGMQRLWSEMVPLLREIDFPEDAEPRSRYHFRNSAFSYGDGSILHAMLRRFRPKRLVEVGSGYSSACAVDTIDRFLGGQVDVTFVEPYPALLHKLLGEDSAGRYTVHDKTVQAVDMEVFTQLQSGDFLFVDSTHIMKTGSDVCHELFNVLPALKSGVFIHFHDIFWPFEYGPEWIVKQNRSWNEIYGLRAFLMFNDAFEIVFFNDWFVRNHRASVEADYPMMLKNTGGSIWLRKVGA